jgi:pyruvate formate lyase activating enzyme
LRLLLQLSALAAFAVIGLLLITPELLSPLFTPSTEGLREAMYYRRLDRRKVQCELCFRRCIIPPGQRGFCGNRKNIGGTLYTLVYGKPCAVQIDPVEKKPLYHVLPGSSFLSIGTAGCNFRCSFCINWHMSHRRVEEVKYLELSPEEVVRLAVDYGCEGIAFTYNEPTVFYEYMLEVARLARERGLVTMFHSNGAINPEPLKELLKYIDAVAIDLKAFDDDFYSYVVEQSASGRFQPSTPPLEAVLRTLKTIREEGRWLEIVYLLIPTLNDDLDEIREMCLWIKENLGEDVPLHFSRFFPACRLTKLPPTPMELLTEARETALEVGLKYVYIGNIPGNPGEDLYCPSCGRRLLDRLQYQIVSNNLERGRCPHCSYWISGLWNMEDVKRSRAASDEAPT